MKVGDYCSNTGGSGSCSRKREKNKYYLTIAWLERESETHNAMQVRAHSVPVVLRGSLVSSQNILESQTITLWVNENIKRVHTLLLQ